MAGVSNSLTQWSYSQNKRVPLVWKDKGLAHEFVNAYAKFCEGMNKIGISVNMYLTTNENGHIDLSSTEHVGASPMWMMWALFMFLRVSKKMTSYVKAVAMPDNGHLRHIHIRHASKSNYNAGNYLEYKTSSGYILKPFDLDLSIKAYNPPENVQQIMKNTPTVNPDKLFDGLMKPKNLFYIGILAVIFFGATKLLEMDLGEGRQENYG